MRSTSAAAGGFLAGSALTLLVTVYLWKLQKASAHSSSEEQTNDSSSAGPTSTRTSRSLAASATATTAGAQARVGFLSDIVRELWSHIDVAGSQMIREMIEPILAEYSMHFTKLTLGPHPIRLDNIYVHEMKDNVIQFDMDVLWEAACDIELQAGLVSLGVEAIHLQGRMSFLLHPCDEIPCVSAVQYAFVNQPHINLDFTGMAQVADWKVVKTTILDIVQASLAEMMVLPNRSLYKMDVAANLLDIYQPPLGIARVTLVSGKGFQVEKRALRSDDIPDVYCNMTLGNKLWRTTTIKDSCAPLWTNETCDVVLSDHDQILTVHAMDEDGGPFDPDDDLGQANVTVGEILLSGGTKTVDLLHEDGKCTGASLTVQVQVFPFTNDLSSFQAAKSDDTNSLCGLLEIVVSRAFDLPVPKTKAASMVKVTVGREHEFVTSVVTDYPGIDALNPLYDIAFHVPMTHTNRQEPVVLTLYNGEAVLGIIKVTHASLAKLPGRTLRERRKIGDKGASLEYMVALRGVKQQAEVRTKPPASRSSTRALTAAAGSLGQVRLTAVQGHGFKVQQRGLFRKPDIPDVYCKIKYGSSPTLWRTKTIRNSVTPEWNETSRVYPLRDRGEIIQVDAYDEDKGNQDKDDYYGSARIAVGKLLLGAGGSQEVELVKDNAATGIYVTLRAEVVQD